MQDIINTIKISTNPNEVKQILKPLKIKDVINVAKALDVYIRGNENKTEIIGNIILGIIKYKRSD